MCAFVAMAVRLNICTHSVRLRAVLAHKVACFAAHCVMVATDAVAGARSAEAAATC